MITTGQRETIRRGVEVIEIITTEAGPDGAMGRDVTWDAYCEPCDDFMATAVPHHEAVIAAEEHRCEGS